MVNESTIILVCLFNLLGFAAFVTGIIFVIKPFVSQINHLVYLIKTESPNQAVALTKEMESKPQPVEASGELPIDQIIYNHPAL